MEEILKYVKQIDRKADGIDARSGLSKPNGKLGGDSLRDGGILFAIVYLWAFRTLCVKAT